MAAPRRSKARAFPVDGKPLASLTENGALDEVRDILFGAKVKALEERIGLLEQQLEEANTALRTQMVHLERYVQNEVNTLLERLRNELGSQSTHLADVIQQRHQEATQMISEGLRELRASSTDGALLSNLLVDVAQRLTDEGEAAPAPQPANARPRNAK